MTKAPLLVVVTGTSGGLGSAIASELVERGYLVVGVARRDVDPKQISDSDPSKYHHICWDLGDVSSLKELTDTVLADHGRPYGLVNNAAIGVDGLLPTMHNSQIENVVRLNVTSPLVLTKYMVRLMLSERSGRVVNISSIVASTGYRGLAAYGATKSALDGFTRSLARDLGPRGITVNSVAPGFMDTEMTSGLDNHDLEKIRSRSALKRFAKTGEVAAAVSYLLSPQASSTTGSVIVVDAGSTA